MITSYFYDKTIMTKKCYFVTGARSGKEIKRDENK